MNSTINLSFRYSESDYIRALRAHHASQLRLRLDIAVTFILAGIGIYLLCTSGLHWFSLVCVIIAAVFALMLIVAFTIIPSLVFRQEPKFRDDYSLTFSSEGIHFQTSHIDSQLQWSMYSRALIDSHSYLLYYGTRQFSVIPKRVFQSAEQRQAFEELLLQHVSHIARRDT